MITALDAAHGRTQGTQQSIFSALANFDGHGERRMVGAVELQQSRFGFVQGYFGFMGVVERPLILDGRRRQPASLTVRTQDFEFEVRQGTRGET